MNDFYLKTAVAGAPSEQLREIIHDRAHLVEKYSRLVAAFDADDVRVWPQIISAAREGGLEKDVLCEAFSCAWSTILRWETGRNAPGPFARRQIKTRLLELLGQRRDAELARTATLTAA